MSDVTLTEAELAGFSGSEHYWRHWTGRLVYTDGVRYLAERAAAYWLIDAVASHQGDPHARQEPFQVWVLSVVAGRRAVLELNDGNSTRAIIRQIIEYTDFPLAQISLYLTDSVLMLTGEY